MTGRDPYDVLGVERNATREEVKKAYRRLAFEFHPDRNPGDRAAEDRFKEITLAYEVLNDPDKRARFDRWGTADAPPDLSEMFGGFGLEDAIRAFMENFGFGGFSAGGRSRKGPDIEISVDLDLSEAALGARREVRVRRSEPCPDCSGSGADSAAGWKTCESCGGRGQIRSSHRTILGSISTISSCSACSGSGRIAGARCHFCGGSGSKTQDRSISVDIPAGMSEGHVLMLRGQGHQPGDSVAGDLSIHVRSVDYGSLKREGDDLVFQVTVSFPEAALGTRVRVPAVQGEREVEIPAGTQPGDVVVLRGEGMGRLRGRGRGDLRVVVGVYVPRKLSGSEKKALADLSSSRHFHRD